MNIIKTSLLSKTIRKPRSKTSSLKFFGRWSLGFFLTMHLLVSGCSGNDKKKDYAMQVAMTEAARKQVPDLTLRADWCDLEKENRCEITDVALSPRGDLIALSTISTYDGGEGPKLIIWNIKTNKIEKVIEQVNIVYYAVEWSSDGGLLFAGGECSDTPGGLHLNECDNDDSGYENFSVWNTRNWNRISGMRAQDFLDQAGNDIFDIINIHKIKRSPNGNLLAIQMAHSVVIYDINSLSITGRIIHTNSTLVHVTIMNWSPDGQYIVSGDNDGNMLFWDIETGTKMGELTEDWELSLALWSLDGEKFVSSRNSYVVDDFHCWDMKTGALAWKLPYLDAVDASWSPDGNKLAVGLESGGIVVLNPETGDKLFGPEKFDKAFNETVTSWSPDGSRLAAYGNDFGKVWDTGNWVLLQDNEVEYNNLRNVEWSSDGNFYITWTAFGSKYDDFHLPYIDIWSGY